jgi:hypothetical protein
MSSVDHTAIQGKSRFLKKFRKDFLSIEVNGYRVAILFVLLMAVLVVGLILFNHVARPNYYKLRYGMSNLTNSPIGFPPG